MLANLTTLHQMQDPVHMLRLYIARYTQKPLEFLAGHKNSTLSAHLLARIQASEQDVLLVDNFLQTRCRLTGRPIEDFPTLER
jgi:hypothetical protein